jgi:hypothetical protein
MSYEEEDTLYRGLLRICTERAQVLLRLIVPCGQLKRGQIHLWTWWLVLVNNHNSATIVNILGH